MPLKIHENILVFYKHLPTYNPQMRGNEERIVKRNGLKAKTTNYGNHIEIPLSKYNGRYPIDIIKFKKDKLKVHPTQKPVSLLSYLIKTYTKEGDLVLDFTMGSGSTGVACQNTGRKFIGIELDEDYFKIAKERMNNCQTRLI
jgi:site-specific DNA-methyltransferase (adenine-specific)